MAQVNKSGYLSFNTVDYSAYVRGISEDQVSIDAPDATVWGADAKVSEPGLPSQGLSVQMVFDPTADGTLDAAARAGTKGTIAWRYDEAAKGPTNPEFGATAFVQSYRRGATVGDLQTAEVVFGFTTKVTRTTS